MDELTEEEFFELLKLHQRSHYSRSVLILQLFDKLYQRLLAKYSN